MKSSVSVTVEVKRCKYQWLGVRLGPVFLGVVLERPYEDAEPEVAQAVGGLR